MAKPYSDMTNTELVAIITELEDELRESWEDIVQCVGHFREEGQYKGWWAHQYRSSVKVAMRDLIRAGYWERHPENDYYARPIEKDEPEDLICQD